MPSPLEEFDQSLTTLTTERGQIYGHPADDFAKVAAIKSVLASCPDPRLRHALEMIAVKMCRLCQTPTHLDSWTDIAGYARTAVMIIDRGGEKIKDEEFFRGQQWGKSILGGPPL